MYFTEENIKDLAQGFREGEKYFGDYTENYNSDYQDKNYTQKLGVAVDIGRYIDSVSNAYPLNKNSPEFEGGTGINKGIEWRIPGQRKRYGSGFEVSMGLNTGAVSVDSGRQIQTADELDNGFICRGTIPFGKEQNLDGKRLNDGQQLSSIVFSSRYYEDMDISKNNIYPSKFSNLNDNLSNATSNQFSVSVGPDGSFNSSVFQNQYTDSTGKNISTNDLLLLAQKYDISACPVFPVGSPANFNKNNKPYIALRSHLKLDEGEYNTDKNGMNDAWQIDSRNCNYGMQIGLDPSFIRNNAILLLNSNYANPNTLINGETENDSYKANVYNQVLMLGSINPDFSFNAALSRFQFSGFNTPMTIGNGYPGQNQRLLEPTSDPEQQVYNLNIKFNRYYYHNPTIK